MSRLTADVVTRLRAAQTLAVILDPDEMVERSGLEGEVVEVREWWALRSAYERLGRRRVPTDNRLVLLLRGPFAGRPLPWDIEQASTVISIRVPGPPSVRVAIKSLDHDEIDRAITAVAGATGDPEAALLTALTGVPLSARPTPLGDQLRLAARIAVRSYPSVEVAELARRYVTDPLLVALLSQPSGAALLQAEWNRYAGGEATPWASTLATAAIELGQLFAVGVLTPVVASRAMPAWAGAGVRNPTNEERAAERLDNRPEPFPPTDLLGWCSVAEWWADVRRLTADGDTELRRRAWETWADIDAAWLPWLRSTYGTLLSSASRWPTAVHRVAAHLSRRMREGLADRVLLVVLDGLGHTQWAHLRDRLSVQVVEAGSTCALVPTYTTVSRQAIFAGDLPLGYPESLWTTQPEPRRWDLFWRDEGFGVTCAAYHRVKGRFPHDHIEFGAARAVGVVVNAVDDLMHTSELLGDAQLLANLDVWVANGFLEDLVRRASEAGFETWVTADHGNIECEPAGRPSEGVAIEATGKRLLRYPNRTLRDASGAEGIVWDEIPGMPPDAEPLRFAAGRSAYTNDRISVSHGGLSIDEVIVPLARVEP